jgi:hypothetical protein
MMYYILTYFLVGMILATCVLVWARNWGGDTWANRPVALPIVVFAWLPMVLLGALMLFMAALPPTATRSNDD